MLVFEFTLFFVKLSLRISIHIVLLRFAITSACIIKSCIYMYIFFKSVLARIFVFLKTGLYVYFKGETLYRIDRMLVKCVLPEQFY